MFPQCEHFLTIFEPLRKLCPDSKTHKKGPTETRDVKRERTCRQFHFMFGFLYIMMMEEEEVGVCVENWAHTHGKDDWME